MHSYSLFNMDNFLRTALDDTWMGVRLTFRPEQLSSSFTTMNKFVLVTCESDSRYLISSLLVLTRSMYPNISNFYRSCTSYLQSIQLPLSTIKQRREIYIICQFLFCGNE